MPGDLAESEILGWVADVFASVEKHGEIVRTLEVSPKFRDKILPVFPDKNVWGAEVVVNPNLGPGVSCVAHGDPSEVEPLPNRLPGMTFGSLSQLPKSAVTGSLYRCLDTETFYVWDGEQWALVGTPQLQVPTAEPENDEAWFEPNRSQPTSAGETLLQLLDSFREMMSKESFIAPWSDEVDRSLDHLGLAGWASLIREHQVFLREQGFDVGTALGALPKSASPDPSQERASVVTTVLEAAASSVLERVFGDKAALLTGEGRDQKVAEAVSSRISP